MIKINSEEILIEYDRDSHLYDSFTARILQTLHEILRNFNCHSITSRTKNRDSLKNKLAKSNASYESLADITDISGIRITTYFEDDVSKISSLLEKSFEIDKLNSVDKKTITDPERFGYVSMHHVVSFKGDRCSLADYKRFEGLKAEIQTRTILQHAWAEIEHDLGYKNEEEIPKTIRRKFSRLSGLLELADQEFLNIRNDVSEYSKKVEKQLSKQASSVLIDSVSMRKFIKTSKIVKRIDELIVKAIPNASYNSTSALEYNNDPTKANFFGIHSIKQLEGLLTKNSDRIVLFAKLWITESSPSAAESPVNFNLGISIFYLWYVIACEDQTTLHDYVENHLGIHESLIDSYLDAYKLNFEKVVAELPFN